MKASSASNRQGWLFLLGYWMAFSALASSKVDFNRDIRPLLSEKCYACHGPDAHKVKGGLRLDLRSSATQPAHSGKIAIVPGKPGQSDLVRRIFTEDADDRMPPPASHKSLSPAQQELLKRWISEGAEYRIHWAYGLPVRPAIPSKQNPIDYLVRHRLKEAGLEPSPQAEPRI